MSASDFNRARRSKKRARIETFGCRSEEDDFGLNFKNFLKVSARLPHGGSSWVVFRLD